MGATDDHYHYQLFAFKAGISNSGGALTNLINDETKALNFFGKIAASSMVMPMMLALSR